MVSCKKGNRGTGKERKGRMRGGKRGKKGIVKETIKHGVKY